MNNFLSHTRTKKIIYLSIFLYLFSHIFVVDTFDNWQEKYQAFHVPAYYFPGADSRNIQKAAYCHSQGYDYYNDKKCFKYTILVPKIYAHNNYPQPRYNYPPIVADIYGLFDDYSEEFFQKFWIFNMLFLLFTILIYSYKINYLLFPVIIFSPITLLEIERANIDGIVFSMLFLPLLLSTFIFLYAVILAIVASIKIFPAIGFLALYQKKIIAIKQKIFAILLVSPLLIASFLHLGEYLKFTKYGFDISFGLTSLKYSTLFHGSLSLAYLAIFIYIVAISIMIFFIFKKTNWIESMSKNIHNMEQIFLNILLMSLIIYLFVFLLFTNWAYRFIFLIPVFLIVSNFKDTISRIIFYLIFITLWIPFLPHGWMFFNLMNYILFPFLMMLFIKVFKYHYKYIEKK